MPKQYFRPPGMADDRRAPEPTRHLAPTAREDLKQNQEEDVLEEQQTLVADSAKGGRTAEAAVTAELRSEPQTRRYKAGDGSCGTSCWLEPSSEADEDSARVINPVRAHSVELIEERCSPLGVGPDPDPSLRWVEGQRSGHHDGRDASGRHEGLVGDRKAGVYAAESGVGEGGS